MVLQDDVAAVLDCADRDIGECEALSYEPGEQAEAKALRAAYLRARPALDQAPAILMALKHLVALCELSGVTGPELGAARATLRAVEP